MDILNNIIIPLISAFIGGVFSVWIFNKGLNKKEQEIKRNRIVNNYQTEEYFFYNLNSILYFIDKQVDEITKTSQNTKNWFHKNLTLATFSELKMTELRELNFKTLFQILVIDREGKNEEKAEDFINIKNCLHNIDDFIEKHKKDNHSQYNEINIYLDNWNSCLKKFTQLYNHYIFLKPNENDLLMPILKKYIVIEQRKLLKVKDEQNMEIYYQKIIQPLKNEILKYENKNDERILPIVDNLMECQKSYEQTKAIRYQRRKTLLSSGRRLITIKQILEESIKNIKNRKKRIK